MLKTADAADAANVANVADAADAADAANVANVADVANIAGVADVADAADVANIAGVADADAAARLTEILLPIMRYRIAALGVDGSGAYEFYRTRTESGRVFGEYERRLVDRIAAKGLPADEIHEIGCGWGQLVFLLAWRGYTATGFELDDKRFRGADCLRRILAEIAPEHAARATIRNEFFPPLSRPDPQRSLVIATNIVVAQPQFVEDQLLWGLRRYRYAIIDIDRFCTMRGPEAYPTFLARAEAMGLRSLGLFWDAGGEGHFYLFEPANRRGDASA